MLCCSWSYAGLFDSHFLQRYFFLQVFFSSREECTNLDTCKQSERRHGIIVDKMDVSVESYHKQPEIDVTDVGTINRKSITNVLRAKIPNDHFNRTSHFNSHQERIRLKIYLLDMHGWNSVPG